MEDQVAKSEQADDLKRFIARIMQKTQIFPSWDGRGYDDRAKEFDVFFALGYTYNVLDLERALENEIKIEENRDPSNNDTLKAALTQVKGIRQEVSKRCEQLARNLKRLYEDVTLDKIDGDLIDKFEVELFSNLKFKAHRVVTVPDLWFPMKPKGSFALTIEAPQT